MPLEAGRLGFVRGQLNIHGLPMNGTPAMTANPTAMMIKALADIEQIALDAKRVTDPRELQTRLEQIHAIARYQMPVPMPNEGTGA